jgi:hypothetical protein
MSKAKSGGGITSPVTRKGAQRVAPRTTNVIDPHAPDFLGQATSFKKPPFVKATAPDFAPMGNSLTNNMGKGGPGAGRTVMHCGSQGFHGAASSGEGKMQGTADRGPRQILGPPANTGAVRRGQQRGE